VRRRAVSKVQVDQALIGNTLLFRHFLEIIYRIFVKPDRYLLLEFRGIRIGLGVGKVVVITHGGTPHIFFFRVSPPSWLK